MLDPSKDVIAQQIIPSLNLLQEDIKNVSPETLVREGW